MYCSETLTCLHHDREGLRHASVVFVCLAVCTVIDAESQRADGNLGCRGATGSPLLMKVEENIAVKSSHRPGALMFFEVVPNRRRRCRLMLLPATARAAASDQMHASP